MAGELVGWEQTLALMPYNTRFREMRHLMRGILGPGVVGVYSVLQERVCARFLGRVLDTPELI